MLAITLRQTYTHRLHKRNREQAHSYKGMPFTSRTNLASVQVSQASGVCSARATARNMARRLFRVSSHSSAGTESATMPPPA